MYKVSSTGNSFVTLLLILASCFVMQSWSIKLTNTNLVADQSQFSIPPMNYLGLARNSTNTTDLDDTAEDDDDISVIPSDKDDGSSSGSNSTEPVNDDEDEDDDQESNFDNSNNNNSTEPDNSSNDDDDSSNEQNQGSKNDTIEPVDPVEDNNQTANETRYYSHRAEEFEQQGLIHMIAFADKSNVYLWDPVANTTVVTLLDNLPLTTGIAVDPNKGYIFVCTYEQEERKSLVYRYEVKVDLTSGIQNPSFSLNRTEGSLMYTGKAIEGITVDGDQSILYIADQGTRRIISINYGQESMKQYGTNIGLSKNLYEEEFNLKSVSAVAVNHLGNVYWSCEEDGRADGSIFISSADDPNDASVHFESKNFDDISALAYANDKLYFIADNQTSVYVKIPKDQHSNTAKPTVLVDDSFTKATDVSVNDNFIYVSDQVDGLFVIERLEDGTFSEKREMYLDEDYKMTSMLVFTLGATTTLVQVGLIAAMTALAYLF